MSADIIDVSLCPGCKSLTTMRRIKDDKYFCRLCKEQFRQYKNGKLIYIPLRVSDLIEQPTEKLKFEFEPDSSDVTLGDIIFEPEFDED